MSVESIHDIIVIGYNFNDICIKGNTVKSSLGFIENGCPRSHLLYSTLSQYTLYNLVPDNIQWCVRYPSGWSVRSARGGV